MNASRLTATEIFRSATAVCIAVAERDVSPLRFAAGFHILATLRPRAVVLRDGDDVTVTSFTSSPDRLESLCQAVPELADLLALR